MNQQPFQRPTQLVGKWKRPLLITHTRPDGDAIGSVMGLSHLLTANGARPLNLLYESPPPLYAPLYAPEAPAVLGQTLAIDQLAACDGVIVLDTCAYAQLEPLADWLRERRMPILAVDHHITRDDLADEYLIDESAAATCLILHDWARAAGWPLDGKTADALFAGLSTDTGWFRHSNTDARVFDCAAALVSAGVRPHVWYERIYQGESPARFRLRAAALGGLMLRAADRLAVISITKELFERSGAGPADTEDLINEPLRMASVIVSLLFTEQDNGVIRVGFRSRAASELSNPPIPDIDVSAVARQFGGGGHARAAGARMSGSLSAVRDQVVQALEQRLNEV